MDDPRTLTRTYRQEPTADGNLRCWCEYDYAAQHREIVAALVGLDAVVARLRPLVVGDGDDLIPRTEMATPLRERALMDTNAALSTARRLLGELEHEIRHAHGPFPTEGEQG